MVKIEPIDLHKASDVAVAKTKQNWFFTVRFRIALLLCFGFAAIQIMQVNLNFAMICMLNVTAIDEQMLEADGYSSFAKNHSAMDFVQIEPGCKDLRADSGLFLGNIVWSPRTQGLVFAASVWGLMFMIFTGWFADKMNSKYVIGFSIFWASLASLLTPLASMYKSIVFVLLIRVSIGFCEALVQPSVNCIITRWFPATERNTVLSIATGGRQLGTLLILPISGELCAQSKFFNGWPSVFYVSSIIGIVWTVLWLLFAADKPAHHTGLSERERSTLQNALQDETLNVKRKDKVVPWCKILSSPVCWATMVSVVCHEFPLRTFSTFIPNYYRDVLYFSIKANGVYSALPLVCFFICKLSASTLADGLQKRFNLNKTSVAKIANSVASFGLGAFLIAVSFLDCHCPVLAVVFLCLSMAFGGLHTPGCIGTLLRIAPAYSGSITGIAYEMFALSALINAIVTKEIVKFGTRKEWSIVFYISAAVAFLPLIVFNLWGSAEVQDWAKPQPEKVDAGSEKKKERDDGEKDSTGEIYYMNDEEPLKLEVAKSDGFIVEKF